MTEVGQTSGSASLDVRKLIPQLEGMASRQPVPYHRRPIVPKEDARDTHSAKGRKQPLRDTRVRSSKASRLHRQIVLRALIDLLKNNLRSPPSHPRQESSTHSNIPHGNNIISYDGLVDYFCETNAEDGKPWILRDTSDSFRRESLLLVKRHVCELNKELRAELGIEFQGRAKLYYELSSCTTDAPVLKSGRRQQFAETFCSDLSKRCESRLIEIHVGRAFCIGDTLQIQLKSPISGWLSLVIVAPDGSDYLVPATTSMKFEVEKETLYELPTAADPLIDWELQGQPGLYLVMAFVSPSHERLLMPPKLDVRIRHDRGVGFQARDIRDIPDIIAFGSATFIVKKKKHDPR